MSSPRFDLQLLAARNRSAQSQRAIAARNRSAQSLNLGLAAGLAILFPFSPVAFAETSSTAVVTSLTPAIWNNPIQGTRITAMCEDGRGRVFAASEENGVWMRGRQGQWSGFTPQNSSIASDMIYALACDKQGRIWAGTARHGVSVFNGRSWKNFDVLQAPIGERIFDIAVSPLDGDVWIASNIGLTRYIVKTDKWTTLYPTAKLPLSHLQSLAFSAKGVLYAGSQSDGLFIAKPQKSASGNSSSGNIEYSKWRKVVAPSVIPDASSGSGLPSNLINDILVARDKTVYVATPTGLAWSKDNSATWEYRRGRDWVEKARQRLIPAPIKDSPSTENTLNEDYVASLAEDTNGKLWLAHWRAGYEVLDAKTQKVVLNGAPGEKTDDAHSNGEGDYVRCVLPLSSGATFIGRYGKGVTLAPPIVTAKTPTKAATPKTATLSTRSATSTTSTPISTIPITTALPSFPTPQAAPTLAELNALLKQLGAVPVAAAKNASPVIALDDDWNTRGDWLGRYGRYWANLCAMIRVEDGGDYIWGAGYKRIRYASRIGPNADKDDAVRYWVHWLYTTNPNTLEIPPVYLHSRVLKNYTTWDVYRRQSEIDDHGEAYPYQKDGPHLYTTLQIPKGDFVLSLSNFNKDGDSGENRKRDYRISIRSHNENKPLEDISDFHQQPEFTSARIRDFRNGVWKRFLVTGPRELTIEINRNSSHNTILAGITLDELKEKPAPYFRTIAQDRVLDAKLQKAQKLRMSETSSTRLKRFAPTTTKGLASNRLFAELDWLRVTNPTWWAQSSRKFYLPLTLWYSVQVRSNRSEEVKTDTETKTVNARLSACLWALRLFKKSEEQQRKMRVTPAQDIEKAIRWDGITNKDSGSGYEIVTDYLKSHHQTANKTVALKETKQTNNATR